VAKTFVGLVVFLLASIAMASGERYVNVPYEGPESVKKIVDQGFEVGGINLKNKRITLIVADGEMAKTRELRVLSSRPVGRPDSEYKNPAEVEMALLNWENQYPHLLTVEKIGNSGEGRPIYAAHLTAKFVASENPKPAILFDAMHHAREVMTVEVGLDIIEYLTTRYATDPKVQEWLNHYSIWVVPMVNPDGNNKVWNGNSMWRKNTSGGSGVDVNRNYPYAWNSCNGSSGNPSSLTYRGPSAGSELEGKALTQLTARIQPKFNISYHSFSELVIYPFGCSPKKIPSPDREIYEKYGKALAATLVSDSGSGSYNPGTSYELLYNVDGGSIDWMYASEKVMSFVIEMNSDAQGFQPSYAKWRNKTVERQRAGWQYLLEQMKGPGIKPVTR